MELKVGKLIVSVIEILEKIATSISFRSQWTSALCPVINLAALATVRKITASFKIITVAQYTFIANCLQSHLVELIDDQSELIVFVCLKLHRRVSWCSFTGQSNFFYYLENLKISFKILRLEIIIALASHAINVAKLLLHQTGTKQTNLSLTAWQYLRQIQLHIKSCLTFLAATTQI